MGCSVKKALVGISAWSAIEPFVGPQYFSSRSFKTIPVANTRLAVARYNAVHRRLFDSAVLAFPLPLLYPLLFSKRAVLPEYLFRRVLRRSDAFFRPSIIVFPPGSIDTRAGRRIRRRFSTKPSRPLKNTQPPLLPHHPSEIGVPSPFLGVSCKRSSARNVRSFVRHRQNGVCA